MSTDSLELHPVSLNLMLLSVPTASEIDLAEMTSAAIHKLAPIHSSSSKVQWLEQLEPKCDADWAELEIRFKPRIYAGLGPFDLLALYLAPNVGPPYAYASDILHTGKHLHTCLLPKLSGGDFNADFVEDYETHLDPLPAAARFTAIIKLRLNGCVVWPADGGPPQERFLEVLEATGESIRIWLREEAPPGARAGLGLGFGWSEFVAVAHSPSIASLLHLIWKLRKNAHECWWGGEDAHTFATSISYVGYDLEILRAATDKVKATLDEREDPEPPPGEICQWVEELSSDPAFSLPAAPEGGEVCFGMSFEAFPGHEANLAAALEAIELRDLVERTEIREATTGGIGILGRNDVAGPVLRSDSQKAEVQSLWFFAFVRLLLYRGGQDPFPRVIDDSPPSKPEQRRGIVHFSSTETHVGLAALRTNEALPDRHHRLSPSELPAAVALAKSLHDAIAQIAEHTRILQVGYSATEQVVHLIAKYSWTASHDVLWDDAPNLGPLVFCLRDHLDDLRHWWLKASLDPSPVGSSWEYLREPEATRAEFVQHVLRELSGAELPALLGAFRANFHYRHLGGYLSDRTPDLNLRYQGSVQQVLSIAAMSLDAMVTLALGPRACIATVGDTYEPTVEQDCDVVIVNLHGDTLMQPILLDTLGHEVGHLLMLELRAEHERKNRALSSGRQAENKWRKGHRDCASYRTLYSAFAQIIDDAFYGEIEKNDHFLELSADLTEFWILGIGDLTRWLQSFMLRQLMAAPVVQQDRRSERPEPEPHALVPAPNKDWVRQGLIRTVMVRIVLELMEHDDVPDEWDTFLDGLYEGALAEHRDTVFRKCCIGPSQELLYALTRDKQWDELLLEMQEQTPWLFDGTLAKALSSYFRALHRHIEEGEERLETDESEMRTIWKALTSELATLRDAVLPLTENSMHVRHWITTDELLDFPGREELKERHSKSGYFLPWRVCLQPPVREMRYQDEGTLDPPEVHLLQRGRIHAATAEGSRVLLEASSRFLGCLMTLIPAWRKATFNRIDRIEEGNTGDA